MSTPSETQAAIERLKAKAMMDGQYAAGDTTLVHISDVLSVCAAASRSDEDVRKIQAEALRFAADFAIREAWPASVSELCNRLRYHLQRGTLTIPKGQ